MTIKPLLLLITTIAPYPENRGEPSGLPWEILEVLKLEGWEVRVQMIPLSKCPISRRLMQLCIPVRKYKIEAQQGELLLAYPFYIGKIIPPALRKRTIVLGPDATSMLYARFSRIESGNLRFLFRILTYWFAIQERWTMRHLAGIAVVGRNDRRWLRAVFALAANRVSYVPHPVLNHVVKAISCKGCEANPRLVFGGDLSRKYIGDFFDSLDYVAVSQILCGADCEVLIVGKGNQSVYDAIAGRLPSKYVAWVEDYASLCDPLRDIHVVPLMAGAGTKNRALTALAMNVIVLTTPIGIENVQKEVVCAATVHRFRSNLDFPLALVAGLNDLKSRRSLNEIPPPPPIELIKAAFKAAIIGMTKKLFHSTREL